MRLKVEDDYDAKFEELLAALRTARRALWECNPHSNPQVRQAIELADAALCPECLDYLEVHSPRCKLHPDHDPAPKE